MKTSLCAAFSVVVMVASLTGCTTEPPGPSYADLVTIYNAELEQLDRLEKKKADMIAEYKQQHQPSAEDALQALTGLLGSTIEANEQVDFGDGSDPNEMLDQAVANAEQAQQTMSKALESATSQRQGGEIEYSEEFKQQLAEIDAEIEKQKARVEKARKARDAAEP